MFIVILLLFLIAIDVLLVSNLRSQLVEEMSRDSLEELNLVALFLREPLLRRNYDEAEQILLQWGEEHHDILTIKAVMPNGFTLAQFVNNRPFSDKHFFDREIILRGSPLINLSLIKDFGFSAPLRSLQWKLIAGSCLIAIFMGLIIWFTMSRFSIVPLEKEVLARSRSEQRLFLEKGSLEKTIRKRTKDLEQINKRLSIEISERKKVGEELKKRVQELEEFYELAVNRELRMKELKEEIIHLKSELSEQINTLDEG